MAWGGCPNGCLSFLTSSSIISGQGSVAVTAATATKGRDRAGDNASVRAIAAKARPVSMRRLGDMEGLGAVLGSHFPCPAFIAHAFGGIFSYPQQADF